MKDSDALPDQVNDDRAYEFEQMFRETDWGLP